MGLGPLTSNRYQKLHWRGGRRLATRKMRCWSEAATFREDEDEAVLIVASDYAAHHIGTGGGKVENLGCRVRMVRVGWTAPEKKVRVGGFRRKPGAPADRRKPQIERTGRRGDAGAASGGSRGGRRLRPAAGAASYALVLGRRWGREGKKMAGVGYKCDKGLQLP